MADPRGVQLAPVPATWCIDMTAGRVDVTTRIAHAFPDTPSGALSLVAVCGLRCTQRQDVAHTRYTYTECEMCRERGTR